MTASKFIRGPLGTILAATLIAAMVSFFVFVQSGEAAPAANDQPSAAKASYQIVGGTPVPNGKYPFMAALIDTRIRGTIFHKQFCGGSLIDQKHVLTAGHCVLSAKKTGPPVFTATPQNTLVIVGRTVLNSGQGKVSTVKNIDVYPTYQGAGTLNQNYDVAVVELSRPVTGIKPIKLASSSQNYLERPGLDATVAGWGSTEEWSGCDRPQPLFPVRMLEAQVPIISDSRADNAWEQAPCPGNPQIPTTDFVPRLMISAGGTDVDTCQGDSGGPLFVRSSGYTQIGITSFGVGCAIDVPGVYTETNAKPIASFIERTAASN